MLSLCAVHIRTRRGEDCDFLETAVFALVDSTLRHGEELSKICVCHHCFYRIACIFALDYELLSVSILNVHS
jgi:hypothetical protein